MSYPRRGEIYLVKFPGHPSDIKERPALVVSLDIRNRLANDIIVTFKGKLKAIIKGVSEEDFEDYLFGNNPKFLATLEKAGEEYLKLGGMSIVEYLKKRGL